MSNWISRLLDFNTKTCLSSGGIWDKLLWNLPILFFKRRIINNALDFSFYFVKSKWLSLRGIQRSNSSEAISPMVDKSRTQFYYEQEIASLATASRKLAKIAFFEFILFLVSWWLKFSFFQLIILVLKRGVEPLQAHCSLDPEPSVSTNSTTSAHSEMWKKNLSFVSQDKLRHFAKFKAESGSGFCGLLRLTKKHCSTKSPIENKNRWGTNVVLSFSQKISSANFWWSICPRPYYQNSKEHYRIE